MFKIKQTYETPLSIQDIENWLREKKNMAVIGYDKPTYKVSFDGTSFSIKPDNVNTITAGEGLYNRNNSFQLPNNSIIKGTYQVNATGIMQVDLEISSYIEPTRMIGLAVFNLMVLGMIFMSTVTPSLLILAIIAIDATILYTQLIKGVQDTQPWIEKELQLTKLNTPST